VLAGRARFALDCNRIGTIKLSLTHDRVSVGRGAAERARRCPGARTLHLPLPPLRRKVSRELAARLRPDAARRKSSGSRRRTMGICFVSPASSRIFAGSRPGRSSRWCASKTSRPVAARDQGKGILILTGHFGNWEVATIAAIGHFPEM
jgi:hypothetical protein